MKADGVINSVLLTSVNSMLRTYIKKWLLLIRFQTQQGQQGCFCFRSKMVFYFNRSNMIDTKTLFLQSSDSANRNTSLYHQKYPFDQLTIIQPNSDGLVHK